MGRRLGDLDFAALAVGWNRDIHLLGPRQVKRTHDRDKFLDALAAAEPRVAGALLADAADPPLLIVVTRIDQRVVRQREELVGERDRGEAR